MFKEGLPSKTGSPDSLETKRSLDVFRNKVMRAALLGGFLSVVQACGGLKDEEIQQLPKTSLEEIRKDPKRFLDGPMIRTEGYPILDHFVRKSFGDRYKKWSFYTLNEGPKADSQPVLIYYEEVSESELTSVINERVFDERRKKAQHKNLRRHRIVGTMRETSRGYAIEVVDTLDLEQPAEKAPEKK